MLWGLIMTGFHQKSRGFCSFCLPQPLKSNAANKEALQKSCIFIVPVVFGYMISKASLYWIPNKVKWSYVERPRHRIQKQTSESRR